MSGHVYIYNDTNHLRIVNNKTKVVSYMAKQNLVIQKDNDSTFFFKNDSYVKYFKKDEIALPIASTLDDMLEAIIAMLNVNFIDEMITVSELEKADTVLDINVYSDKNTDLITEKIYGSASASHASNIVSMDMNTISANSTNRIIRQSKEYVNIASGKINITLVSGKLVTDTSSFSITSLGDDTGNYVQSKLGMFDANNGIYIQYKGSNDSNTLIEEYSIVKIIDGVTETIPQADWNSDVCDGNGVSGINLSKEDMHTFIFRLGTLPNTFIQVGIMYKGKSYLVHEFKIEHFFRKLPIRWEIEQFATNQLISTLQMIQNNAVVLSSEKHNITKNVRSTLCPLNNFKSLTIEATEDLVFDIKLNSAYVRSKVKLEKVNIVNTESNGVVLWKLIKNGTIVDLQTGVDASLTYQTTSAIDIVSKISSQSYDGDGVLQLNDYLKVKDDTGILIASGYIMGNSVTNIDMTNDANTLYSDVEGNSDHISLIVKYINSPAEIQASATWIEYE